MYPIIARASRQALWRQTSAVAASASRAIPSLALRSPFIPSSSQSQSKFSSLSIRYQSSSVEAKAQIPKEVREKLGQDTPAKIYTYEEIKNLVTNPDPSKILVDVREPSEVAVFAIPTSINIPYKSTPGALDLSEEDFEEFFKFAKPDKEKELIFYCLAGVRSTAATELAQMFGYNKVGNYTGSVEDWAKHEGVDLNKLYPKGH